MQKEKCTKACVRGVRWYKCSCMCCIVEMFIPPARARHAQGMSASLRPRARERRCPKRSPARESRHAARGARGKVPIKCRCSARRKRRQAQAHARATSMSRAPEMARIMTRATAASRTASSRLRARCSPVKMNATQRLTCAKQPNGTAAQQ